MNYYYIDFMIRERQREEQESCERRRLLKSAGYHPQKGLLQKAGGGFLNAVHHLKEWQAFKLIRLHPCYSMANNVAHKKGAHQ